MRNAVLLVLFTFFQFKVSAQKKYWQQQVNYKIAVGLNDKLHELDAVETIEYFNNSPDTLHFIWIHLWPNAYKNDRTAFSDQLLLNGRTDFYFSTNEQRGFINRLNFKVNGVIAVMEDHPQHQDIIKLLLPSPLVPGGHSIIQTPFHVKIPDNFSRAGHVAQSYQITQWYPKAAVYDKNGWHPMPYLDQGEFYSDFGNYEVSISLPANYVVAATGLLIKDSTALLIKENQPLQLANTVKEKTNFLVAKKNVAVAAITPSSQNIRTIVYQQNNVIDFAWFADKDFAVLQDTLALASGKIIKVMAYPLQKNSVNGLWKNAIQYMKKSILSRSNWLGEYPYNVVSIVEAELNYTGGMEYPTITVLSGAKNSQALESVIEHELGHNWNFGILATNERTHPWMDEGINTFFDTRYWNGSIAFKKKINSSNKFIANRLPENLNEFLLSIHQTDKKDQPIETSSELFASYNYGTIAYIKTSQWMGLLEQKLGRTMFDSCMHTYFQQWKFKHPGPDDFKNIMESVSGTNLDEQFLLLNKKGGLPKKESKKTFKLSSVFNFKDTDKYKYLFLSPAIGFNIYDKQMVGLLLHNYTLPTEKFQFLIAPLYGTGSKQLNGLGRLEYGWHPTNTSQKITISLATASFSNDAFTDSTGKKNYLNFSKIVPGIKIVFANKNPLSQIVKFLQWKTFFIGEKMLRFTRDTVNQKDDITYPVNHRYLNQLQFGIENNRVLYPFKALLQAEQGDGFARLAVTAKYFFNYAKGGGMQVRFFAGKFFYLGEQTFTKQFETDPYHLNLTGPKGYEDYTYSNYFVGRNAFDKLSSQQIMERDGFFKVRTDLLSSKIGKSDNWLAAMNFTTDVPKSINPLQVLPFVIPFKVFVDVGTYAEAWQKNANQSKFIFDAGLQFSLLRGIVNVYVPLLYSKVYGDYFKSTITEKRFLKNIAFSIDIQNMHLKKIFPQFGY